MDQIPVDPIPIIQVVEDAQIKRPELGALQARARARSGQTNDNALDPNSLAALKLRSKGQSNPNKAISDASKQIESLFIGNALKQFRSASKPFQSNLISSNATETYNQMLDTQLSQSLATPGIGLSKVFEAQIRLRSQKQEKRNQDSKIHGHIELPDKANSTPLASSNPQAGNQEPLDLKSN